MDRLSEEAQIAHEARAARMRRIGEPWLTYFDTDELSARCADLGLAVSEDLGPSDIAVRWFGRSAEELPRAGGHVVVATSA
jgi:hypothetical protein